MSKKHDMLAEWASSDAPTIAPDAIVRQGTPTSRAATAALLLEAAETPAEVEEIERASMGGRPSLDASGPAGVSPLWQIRAPQALDAAMRARAAAEGRTFSELLRDAASQYLTTHAS